MSSLIQKIRDKTRSRSKSRRTPRQSDDRFSGEHVRNSRDSSASSESEMSSPSQNAWHVHKGGRNSTDVNDTRRQSNGHAYTDSTPLPQVNSSSHQSYAQHTADNTRSLQNPDRSSATYNPSKLAESSNYSDTQAGSAVQYPHEVPRRRESLPQNRQHNRNSGSIDRRGIEPRSSNSIEERRLNQPSRDDKLRVQPAGGKLGTEIDQALESLSVNDKRSTQQQNIGHQNRDIATGTGSNVTQVTEQSEHLRLPAGFKLGRTEETTIETNWRPAVTHENIHHQKTEIIREAITRDIHVHHYYTYVQPIKVVEVLPAKHYRLDEKTGVKVEIPAPAGWEMPSDMRPRAADTSSIKGYMRHYLVNEQYPNGIAEPAPANRKPVQGDSLTH